MSDKVILIELEDLPDGSKRLGNRIEVDAAEVSGKVSSGKYKELNKPIGGEVAAKPKPKKAKIEKVDEDKEAEENK